MVGRYVLKVRSKSSVPLLDHIWALSPFCATHPLDIYSIPAKPLHNSDTVSVHFNHFYYMGICDKLSRHLYMLTYIYLNVGEY